MATRQYIGARYVPKFYVNSVDGSTQWEANVVYDPLIFVTLQNGHMYISKKQVPATVGTPAENVGYWLDMGSYNGFIESLQNQINDIENAMGVLANLDTTDKTSLVNAINEANKANAEIYYLNVKDYGAKGDGATDDTTAIQDCIDDIPNEGKTSVLFPKGTYVINGTVNITSSSVELFGVGEDSCITRTTQSDTPIFLVHNNSAKIDGFDAHDLSFKNITSGECFQLARVFDSEIYRCFVRTIKRFVHYGLAGESNANIWSKVSNIIGNVTTSNSIFAIVTHNTNGVHIYDCQINAEVGNNSKFLQVEASTDIDTIELKDNLVQRMSNPVLISDANNPSGVLQNFFIEGNIFDGCEGSNITINANHGASIITRININDNWFNCNTVGSNNLVFTATTGKITQVSICDNIFVKARSRAILTQGNNIEAIKINSNSFNGVNVDTPESSVNSTITFGGAASGIIVSNNQFSVSSEVTANNTYGVYIASGTSAVLNGNNFNGITTPVTGTPANAKGNYPTSVDT